MHLCFDNYYSEVPDQGDYSIAFQINKNEIMRQNTNLFKFRKFPYTLPLSLLVNPPATSDIPAVTGEHKEIAIIHPTYLDENHELEKIAEKFETTFLLTDTETEHLRDIRINHIYHDDNNWGRTCISILHTFCEHPTRDFCWTKSIPELSLTCFGNTENMRPIQDLMEYAGINEFEVLWAHS